MQTGLSSLTAREKDALRLLLAGHNAKSAARELGLSVHTVNERLRESRRKLGVSSSREAARILAEAEQVSPDFLGYNDLGVGKDRPTIPSNAVAERPLRRTAGFWIGGGLLLMSVIVAAALLFQTGSTQQAPMPAPTIEAAVSDAAQSDARRWLALVDDGKWHDSHEQAAGMFKTHVTAETWASMVEPIRKKLGRQLRRTFKSAQRTTTLPGAPTGDYVMLQFTTAFETADGMTETVVMVREKAAWKVAGYFVRPA